jgi:signal transduction histidine kinase
MVAVAGQVAASLRGVELRAQSERRARRLALTSRIARSIAAAASVDEALEIAAATIFEATEYETVSVIRLYPSRGEASMTVCFDRGQMPLEPHSWPIDTGITGRTYRTGRVLRLGRATHDPDYGWIGDRTFDSLIQAPVMVDESCVAILELADSPADSYNEDDEALIYTAAEQVAAAIRGVQLRADAEASAQRMQRALEAAKAVAAADSAQDVLETFVQTVYEGVGYAAVEASVPVLQTNEQVVVASVSRVTGSYTGIRRPIESGVTGIAFREGRQVHVRDTHAEMVPGMLGAETWRSRMATPVVIDDQVVAVLGISDLEPGRYGEADHVFMRTVAEQVAAALLGARLRDESEGRARRLAVSVAVAGAVAEAATVEETLRAAARALSEQIGCGAVTAYLADEQAGDQVALVDFDRNDVNVEGMRRPAGQGTTGEVFATGRQVRIDGITPGEALVPWLETGTVYRSALITPVTMQGRVAAAIGLYDLEPDRFDRQDEMLLQGVAEQVSTAMSGARLRDELRQRADRLERLEQRHRALLERMVLAQEQERSRVAADLHDDTVQVLSACVIALDRVRRLLEEGEVELISGAVDRTRRMTFELRPAVLWHNGLEAAVRQLIGTVAEESGMQITLESTMEERLDATLETIAFRSIAELIGNARNHSRGTRLDIRLSTAGGQLHAEVADDGRGFDLDQALARARVTNHLGLEAVIERIDAAGGRVDITSAPGEGTTARLSLPVRPAL